MLVHVKLQNVHCLKLDAVATCVRSQIICIVHVRNILYCFFFALIYWQCSVQSIFILITCSGENKTPQVEASWWCHLVDNLIVL
jgi:hypothetical protein